MQASAQKLSADQDEEEDEDEDGGAATRTDSAANVGVTFGATFEKTVVQQQEQQDGAQAAGAGGQSLAMTQSFAQSTFSRVSSMFGAGALSRSGTSFFLGGSSAAAHQRRITPSLVGHLVFVSPFLAWAVLVCAINGAGYSLLKDSGGDIATAGIVTFLIVRCAAALSAAALSAGQQFPPPGNAAAPVSATAAHTAPRALNASAPLLAQPQVPARAVQHARIGVLAGVVAKFAAVQASAGHRPAAFRVDGGPVRGQRRPCCERCEDAALL